MQDMKKILIYILAAGALLASCKPTEILPTTDASTGQPLVNDPITSVTAYVTINGIAGEFTGYPDEDGNIEIVFPYYFPVESDYKVTSFFLDDARVMANLASNVVIKEKLFRLDLNQETLIHVTDQMKKEREFVIYGIIKHLDLKEISDVVYTVSEKEHYNCVVTGDDIMVPFTGPLAEGALSFKLSPHATAKKADGSPLRNGDTVNFNEETFLTVVADDGSEHKYRVYKGNPAKKDKGINADSDFVQYIFSKKLNDASEVGVSSFGNTTSMAVSGDYLVINTRTEDLVVLDRFTGERVGTIPLPDECKKGSEGYEEYRNYCITNDSEGNILLTNYVLWLYGNADAGTPGRWRDLGELKIWKIKDINSQPEEFISWPISEENVSLSFGRRISVTGSLDSEAVITVPCNTWPATSGFYMWTVSEGALVSETPEWVTASGVDWNNNIDVVKLSADPLADYIVFGYSSSARKMTWFNGKNNTIKQQLDEVDSNFICNALDVIDFNGVKYLAAAQLNSFSWGRCDFAWLFDLSVESYFAGEINKATTMGQAAEDVAPKSLVWKDITGGWGANALENPANENGFSDVVLAGSESGYYMYLYFMFCNGYVVGVQFDCIDRGGE